MTDKPKTITEALAQVRRTAPVAPVAKPQNPYEKYGANSPDAGPAAFFRADREAMASRTAAPVARPASTASSAAAPKPTSSVPLPPKNQHLWAVVLQRQQSQHKEMLVLNLLDMVLVQRQID